MNRNTVSFLAVLLLSTVCLAQSSTGTQAAGSASPKIAVPPGTTVQAELLKAIDARKAQPGDEVAAKITQDVKAGDKVVLTKGSKLMGKVTKAQGRAKGQDESELGLTFDSPRQGADPRLQRRPRPPLPGPGPEPGPGDLRLVQLIPAMIVVA